MAGIIANKGLEAVTVREVAKASGFSTRVVSHYFSGKCEVLLLCYQQTVTRAQQRLSDAAAAAHGDIAMAIDVLLPFHDQAREDWLVWVSFWGMAIGNAEFSAMQRLTVRTSRNYFEALLGAAISRLSEPAFNVALASRNLLASLSGMAVQAAFDPQDWSVERQCGYLRRAIQVAVETGVNQ